MDCNGDKSTAQQTNTQQNCKNAACMFYGNQNTEGFCSVCYKDYIKKKNAQPPSNDNSMITSIKKKKEIENTIQNSLNEMKDKDDLESVINMSTSSCNSSSNNKLQNNSSSSNNNDAANTTNNIINNTENNTILNSSINTSKDIISKDENKIKTELLDIKNSNNNSNDNDDNNQISTSSTSTNKSSTPKKPKKRRCGICKKKIGLTGFDCRCGGLFCSTHRYSDSHNCNFDYKIDGREKIRKANPLVQDDKIDRF